MRCEELLETMQSTELAWNQARTQLSELEVLRDALGEELAARDARADFHTLENSIRTYGGKLMSAA
jgi:hypothetical protein